MGLGRLQLLDLGEDKVPLAPLLDGQIAAIGPVEEHARQILVVHHPVGEVADLKGAEIGRGFIAHHRDEDLFAPIAGEEREGMGRHRRNDEQGEGGERYGVIDVGDHLTEVPLLHLDPQRQRLAGLEVLGRPGDCLPVLADLIPSLLGSRAIGSTGEEDHRGVDRLGEGDGEDELLDRSLPPIPEEVEVELIVLGITVIADPVGVGEQVLLHPTDGPVRRAEAEGDPIL